MVDVVYKMRSEVYMDGLLDLINHIQSYQDTKELSMIEIGSYVGESTELFSKYFKNVISIDPFINDYDPNDITCSYMKLEDVYYKFVEVISNYDNITHIKKTSDEAFVDLKNQKFDFVYIDGLHTYDQVKIDIKNYIQLINSNGFIGGHDYHKKWKGVIDAVDETLGSPDLTFKDTSWIKKL